MQQRLEGMGWGENGGRGEEDRAGPVNFCHVSLGTACDGTLRDSRVRGCDNSSRIWDPTLSGQEVCHATLLFPLSTTPLSH